MKLIERVFSRIAWAKKNPAKCRAKKKSMLIGGDEKNSCPFHTFIINPKNEQSMTK